MSSCVLGAVQSADAAAQVSTAGFVNWRFVTGVLLAAALVELDSGVLPAALVGSNDAGAKACASALHEAVGRRTPDPGPLQSLRHLHLHTLRMPAAA